jgi:putative sugar O-methyltransferase
MKKLLDLMLSDLEFADKFYKPTNFWNAGTAVILKDLKSDDDFKDFRSHLSARSLYVPTYEHSIYKKYRKYINQLFRIKLDKNQNIPEIEGIFGTLSGYNKAKTDYRIFLATDIPTYPVLTNINESLVGEPQEYFVFDSKNYSRCFLNYLIGLNFLKKSVNTESIENILEIGGGYGTLCEIFLKAAQNTFYVNIDIPPVAAISSYYLTQLFGEDSILTYDQSRDMEEIDIVELKKEYRCAIFCPWQLPKIRGSFELFVNFMSFQEMEPDVVENYISYIEKLTSKYVLLRNSRSGKRKAKNQYDVGVIEPTTTDRMLEMFKKFEVANRNHVVYGDFSKDFISELICLTKL